MKQKNLLSTCASAQKFSVTLLSLAIAGIFPALSMAQTSQGSQKVEEVVITGTLIRGQAPVGSSVTAINQEAIQNSGVVSTTDVLRQLPQLLNLGADEARSNTVQNAGANFTFASGVNLRGLGTESTLTLANGHRVAPMGPQAGFVDPSIIPGIFIGRLDVVPDGATATYGSDAVGGVINVVYRKGVEGGETQLRYGAGKGINQKQFSQLVGKSWDTGNVIFAYEHNYRSHLLASERNFYTDDLRSWGGPDLRNATNSVPGNILVNGQVRFAIPAQSGVGLTAAQVVANGSTANRTSSYIGADILPKQVRDSFIGTVNQEISEDWSVFLEGFNSKRTFSRLLNASTAQVPVPSTNPYYVSGLPGIAPGATYTVGYSFLNDYGNNTNYGYERASGATTGLNGNLGHDWSLNVWATQGRTDEWRRNTAVTGSTVNAQAALSNPATALNVFGVGGNSAAVINAVKVFFLNQTKYTIKDVEFKADGPLFALPGGLVRAAVGGAKRYDHFTYSNALNQSEIPNPANTAASFVGTDTKRNVTSTFVEVVFPIVGKANAISGIQRLDFSVADRYDKYSDFGKTTNPKFGFTWAPVTGLSFSGTYGTSFRAPTLGDTNPLIGVSYVVNQAYPNPTTANPNATTTTITVNGGNSDLKPETAKTYSFGTSFKPAAIPGLDLSVNYYQIKYTNRITPPIVGSPSLTDPTYAAYITTAATYPGGPAAFLARAAFLLSQPFANGSTAPASTVTAILTNQKANIGIVETHGFDISGQYQWKTSLGELRTGAAIAYVPTYKQSLSKGAPEVDVINTINNPIRVRGRVNAGLRRGAWDGQVTANYTNNYLNNQATIQEVSSNTTFDLIVNYNTGSSEANQWLRDIRVSFGVVNLFDRNPPYVQNRGSLLAFDPQVASPNGRMSTVTVTKKW